MQKKWPIGLGRKHYKEKWMQSAIVAGHKNKEQWVNCFIQCSPLAKDIKGIIQKHWHTVDSNPIWHTIFA